MVQNIKELRFKDMPAVICTAGSYIAKATSALSERAQRFAEGKLLYDSMAPIDVLRFDAHFASDEQFSTFSFPVAYSGGYRYATAVFNTIMGKRFAIVFLEGIKEERESEIRDMLFSLNEEDRAGLGFAFAKSVLAIPDSLFEKEEKRGLSDIKGATRAAVANLSNLRRFSDFEITFSENDEMKSTAYMPEDIPLSSYLQMVIQLLFAAGEISLSRKAEVKLCKYNMAAELRVTVDTRGFDEGEDIDSLCRAFPSAATYLTVCSYVAGINNSLLSVVGSEDMKRVTMVISVNEGDMDEVDFKSRDPMLYFGENFDFVLRYTLLMASGEAEK